MPDIINIKGLSDVEKAMEQLPIKIERNIARGAVRAGINVIKPVAQANVHSISGELAKGLRVSTKVKDGVVIATLSARGPHAFVAHMIEWTGARAHTISPATKAALAVGGHIYAMVHHPGFKAKPFMRPALDSTWEAAVVAAGNYIKQRLATKEGLDTSDISIGTA